MAQLFPAWEQINRMRPQPTAGERRLIEFLDKELDDNYEIYFQPYLNGDMPDIIIMRKGSGVWIIEVKDWNLDSYYIKEGSKWGLVNGSANILSPAEQVKQYKDSLYSLHIEDLQEKKIYNKYYSAIVTCAVYFHKETEFRANEFLSGEQRWDKDYIDILGFDSLTKERLVRLLSNRGLNKPSQLFTNEIYLKFLRYLKPSNSIL